MNTEKYTVDEEHILHRQVAGCEVTIRFCKEENPMIKELVMGILLDSYDQRMKKAKKDLLLNQFVIYYL